MTSLWYNRMTYNGRQAIRVPVEDILLCEARHKHVDLVMADGKRHVVDKTLKQLERELGADFVRVSHRHLVKTDRVDSVVQRKTPMGRPQWVAKVGAQQAVISRSRMKALRYSKNIVAARNCLIQLF